MHINKYLLLCRQSNHPMVTHEVVNELQRRRGLHQTWENKARQGRNPRGMRILWKGEEGWVGLEIKTM